MLQLLLTLPSEAVQWKQLSHQLEKSPHPAPQPPRTSHDTSPPKQTEERQAGGPTSSPTGSTEGSSSSRHSPLARFLPRSPAATPEMGKESPSDLREAGLPGETLQVSSTLGSPCKRPGKGTRPPRLRGSQGSRGLGQAEGSAARYPLQLRLGARWAGGQTQLVPLHKTPRVRMPFTPLAFNYTA